MRLLTGSERGELASSMDRDNWLDYIDERRQWFAEPMLVKPFIDKMILCGVLPQPAQTYSITWPEMRNPTQKEMADTGLTRANALKTYATAPGADMLMPPEQFLRLCMGLNDDQVNEAMEWLGQAIGKDQAGLGSDDGAEKTPNVDPNVAPAKESV
jgi:hypothetical protein